MQVVVEGLSVYFDERPILENFAAVFDGGTTSVVMGPSGSGKSTLLGAIAGQIPLVSGHVIFSVAPGCREKSAARAVDWIHQTSPMLLRRTALDNAVLSAIVRGSGRMVAERYAVEVMTELGISHLAGQRVYRLSGGERQRLAVVRSIVSGCQVILADEPTASLDVRARGSVCDALDVAARQGRVVITATHDDFVAQRADSVIYLGHDELRR